MPLLIAVPPLVVIGLIIAIGLAVTARPVGQAFTSWLRDAGTIGRFVFGPTADIAVRLARWLTRNIGAEWHDLQRVGVAWFSGLYQWADLIITNALEWPLWVWRLQRWLLFVELPKLARAVPHLALKVVHVVTTRVIHVERTIVRLPKLSRAAAKALVSAAVATYVHPFLADLQWLRRHFHALTAVLPRALPLPNIPAIPNLRKRVKRLEQALAAGLGVAVVLRALGRLRLGWIRCNNVRSAGRAICGFNPQWLESLLADGLTIFSLLSVVEFATELRTIEDEALSIMGKLVREWPAA